MDGENKSGKGSKVLSVHVIVFVVHTHQELHYSIPLDEKDTIADLSEKIHRISRLDDENFFGLYPLGVLQALREDLFWNPDCSGQRIPETRNAIPYANQTLVLRYVSK